MVYADGGWGPIAYDAAYANRFVFNWTSTRNSCDVHATTFLFHSCILFFHPPFCGFCVCFFLFVCLYLWSIARFLLRFLPSSCLLFVLPSFMSLCGFSFRYVICSCLVFFSPVADRPKAIGMMWRLSSSFTISLIIFFFVNHSSYDSEIYKLVHWDIINQRC